MRASSPGRSGCGAARRENEGRLTTSPCEMLIGGDDISNDVITLSTGFSMFFLHSRSIPLRADWRKSDGSIDGEPLRIWRRNSNSRDVVASSPSFPRPAARAPRGACSQAMRKFVLVTLGLHCGTLLWRSSLISQLNLSCCCPWQFQDCLQV